jgi:PPM family protein phosphatase
MAEVHTRPSLFITARLKRHPHAQVLQPQFALFVDPGIVSSASHIGRLGMLREKIEKWLKRPSPDRSMHAPGDMPVVVSSDLGQSRRENQDRVAVMRVSPGGNTKPFIAIALADGMGGMRDGTLCAVMTISSFFFGLIKFRGLPPESRLERAAALANDDVFAFTGSQGGATLSAVLFTPDNEPLALNIGDSRIYATHGLEKETGVRRVTVDDSMEEAIGGHGKELLQFIGMGRGIQPHLHPLETDTKRILITSDGVHFINNSTIYDLIINSADSKQLVERLGALVRWCGAPDNASMVVTSISAVQKAFWLNDEPVVQIWDHSGSLDITWLKEGLNGALPEGGQDHLRTPPNPADPIADPPKGGEKGGKATKQRKGRQKKNSLSELEPQLEIEIIEGHRSGENQ